MFRRKCRVITQRGEVRDLIIQFFLPEINQDYDGYKANAHIECEFFHKDVFSIGEDAAQAFFTLPIAVVSYLIGQRRNGFDIYWLEIGDLDYRDFWIYKR